MAVHLSTSRRIGLATGVLVHVCLPVWAQFSSDRLAARDRDERFLRRAKIVESRRMSAAEGVTRPFKLTLSSGKRTQNALWKSPQGLLKGHVEGWSYEIAAYRLDRYLGLHMVPPTVERRFRDVRGSCQLWVSYWKSLAQIRGERLLAPRPHTRDYNRSVYLQRAFDNLIANVDRHPGNVLVTEDWRLILIDHSRAFRVGEPHTRRLIYTTEHADGPMPVNELPREFVTRLRGLNAERLRRVVGDYLTPEERAAVLARKELLLSAIRKRIEAVGEARVLY